LKSIELYNEKRSGCLPFDPKHGITVSSNAPDVNAWNEFIADGSTLVSTDHFLSSCTNSVQSKEMAPFKNKAWPFYDKMVLLVPNAAADGEMTFSAAVDPPLHQDYTAGSLAFPSDDVSFDTSQPLADLDLDELLQVGRDMFSTTDTSLQCGAVDTAIATLQEVIPPLAHARSRSSGGQRTFSTDMSSPYPCPPSSRTSLKLSKGKSRARTPAGSLSHQSSSLASSVPGSKRSRISKAESSMASAAALNGVAGVLSRATDCMSNISGLLRSDFPTEHRDHRDHRDHSPNIVREASAMLNKDTHLLAAEIRGKLAYAFLKDRDLCQVFIELTDPEVRKMFMLNWYEEKYGQLPPEPSSPSFSRPDNYIGQSSSQLPPELPSTSFFSGAQAVQSESAYTIESSLSGAVQPDESNFTYPSLYDNEPWYDQSSYDYNM
jgi:hypothetical protein